MSEIQQTPGSAESYMPGEFIDGFPVAHLVGWGTFDAHEEMFPNSVAEVAAMEDTPVEWIEAVADVIGPVEAMRIIRNRTVMSASKENGNA